MKQEKNWQRQTCRVKVYGFKMLLSIRIIYWYNQEICWEEKSFFLFINDRSSSGINYQLTFFDSRVKQIYQKYVIELSRWYLTLLLVIDALLTFSFENVVSLSIVWLAIPILIESRFPFSNHIDQTSTFPN